MSASRRKPLTSLSQPQSQTPTRYAPSTPHAIRALQQRSGAKTRSARAARKSTATETVRPYSARGILRQLARITAPFTRKQAQTPASVVSEKENVRPDEDEGEDDEHVAKKPRMTLDIDESLDESVGEERPEYEEEDEDSELLAAPTPSGLLDEDTEEMAQPTLTFKAIDFARQPLSTASERPERRKSQLQYGRPDDEEEEEEDNDDVTMLTERGRRAVSEEATGRLSRYSFGSIRMSDFGSELEVKRVSDPVLRAQLEEARNNTHKSFGPIELPPDDTESVFQLRRSSSVAGSDTDAPVTDDDFQLPMPQEDDVAATSALAKPVERRLHARSSEEELDQPSPQLQVAADKHIEKQPQRRLTEIESAGQVSTVSRRRKRQKLTRHGTVVPALPSSLIKHIAIETQVRRGRRKPQLGKDHMKALEQATEWFFEQAGEDLASYAQHGRRKKRVDTSDVMMLMGRQRVLRDEGKLQAFAKDWLPKDMLDELDLPDQL